MSSGSKVEIAIRGNSVLPGRPVSGRSLTGDAPGMTVIYRSYFTAARNASASGALPLLRIMFPMTGTI